MTTFESLGSGCIEFHNTWTNILEAETEQDYFQSIIKCIADERRAGKLIYPKHDEMFNAFKLTSYNQIKVVILGQDPYHGPNQAHGLAFSVKPGVKPPPSLGNILQELDNDLFIPRPSHGCLIPWAKQGVLLLNTAMSVEHKKPHSHAKIGWARFTDTIMCKLNNYPQPLVFLLWGAHAQSKRHLIDETRHLVLIAAHPSPFSVHRGFFGCRHFSQTNAFLVSKGREPIDWSL